MISFNTNEKFKHLGCMFLLLMTYDCLKWNHQHTKCAKIVLEEHYKYKASPIIFGNQLSLHS